MSTYRSTRLRLLWLVLLFALAVSTGPAAQVFPQIPPDYPDARTIHLFGTVTVTLAAQGTVREAENTTTTVSVRAQEIIEYTPEGSVARVSTTGRATAVTKLLELTEKEDATYALDPDDREHRSPEGAVRGLEMVTSREQQAGYFSVGALTSKVQVHTTYTNSEGATLTTDWASAWQIRVPNHTRASPPLEASADDAVVIGGIVEVPGADGKTTGSYTVPILFGRVYGADTEPMLKKAGMLDGDYPGFVPGTITVAWSLTPTVPDAEAVFEPSGQAYYHWRPYPGPDEDTAGDTLTFVARIHKRDNPDEPASQRATFKFELVDVSKEQGVCMNWPVPVRPVPEPQFDLKIEAARNSDLTVESPLVARSKKGLESAEVVVSSFDGAAWGRLQVTAILDDGTELLAHLKDDRSVAALTIPKDDDGNHISDVWEKNFGVAGSDASADDDAEPPPAEHPGDGFSVFEEYRGFWVQGEFMDTNPKVKDLFIHDVANVGIGFFGATQLAVHLVQLEEYGQEGSDVEHNIKVVNVNRDRATRGAQHLLSLEEWSLIGSYGRVQGGPGVPASVRRVMVDVDRCRRAGVDFGFGQAFLDWAIAHELAHGCSVWHHGQGDYDVAAVGLTPLPDGSGGQAPAPEEAAVAAIGGQHSGAMTCIMRYISAAKYYESDGGPYFWRDPSGRIKTGQVYDVDSPGTILCETKGADRDGVPPKVGLAGRGECRKQLNVNDHGKD